LTPDEEADVFGRRAVPPVQAELVHVGDEAPPRLYGFVSEQASSCTTDIVQTLFDWAARAPFSVLFRVEPRPNILKFA
jgi:hypothetical protein